MDSYSYLSNGDTGWFDNMYKDYKANPESVDESWRKFFEGFEFSIARFGEQSGGAEIPKEFKVINLINDYRSRGHLFTRTNPVRERRKYAPLITLEHHGLTEADLDVEFEAGNEVGIGKATLRAIIANLESVYCDSIGLEYNYIRDPEKVDWLRKRIHENANQPNFSAEEKKHIYKKLNQAVSFEGFLHTRFPGQKRFSLEGGEAIIPAMDVLVEHAADLGVRDFVVGMAHRGRLNVLANIFNKPLREVFSEFVAKDYEEDYFDGDVKYHLGYDRHLSTDKNHDVRLTLCPNPSHLEAVDPVVAGLARARMEHDHNEDNSKICPIMIHGDAAISGQGVVYEVVQMAQLKGYQTGGSVHIVINNQVGFTTNYKDGRSSTYCTDVGKVTLSPVFHVNGDDVEAVVHAMKIAIEFRQRYKQDVFIDLLCYRKHGHNEGDEPKFTQPLLYKAISKHANPKQLYIAQLEAAGFDMASLTPYEEEFKSKLEKEFEESKKIKNAYIENFLKKEWGDIGVASETDFESSPNTGVSKKTLLDIAKGLTDIPEGKKFFRKLQKILNDRSNMIENNKLDWGMAELMSYGSLLKEGHDIRFSGQDVERGTFSHRHAVAVLEDDGSKYCHLNNLGGKQGTFRIYNSLLSEYGVLGYDFGYSLGTPNGLTIWEAQFGDFFNGAQIMIDQFITAAEDKWKTQSGLVMLLPHGYEGMGAEHSSARMERFLDLCAENNIQIVNCTTPANFFHVLRRQLNRNFRKPLMVFTPKSLLRHPLCTSTIEDLEKGSFQEVLDVNNADAGKIKDVVFCQGKLYYELVQRREELGADDLALVRLEQIYPFPKKQVDAVLKKYSKADRVRWAQEEPENMGAFPFLLRAWKRDLEGISRLESSSPASGSPKRAEIRQNCIINAVFDRYSDKK